MAIGAIIAGTLGALAGRLLAKAVGKKSRNPARRNAARRQKVVSFSPSDADHILSQIAAAKQKKAERRAKRGLESLI